ncbi:glycine cleavage system H protein [Lachnospiraceae bacterium KHCPX20]|nr:glycine cleavage system H protein [Lachnospiraceae bacterium KHCPX20]
MSERLYSNKHTWVLQDGDYATIGITDFLQEKLGAIMFINLPEVGEKLIVGKQFGDIESKKTVMDLEAPINGDVVEVNDELDDEPDMINEAPYDSWFIKVKIDSIPDDLLNEDEYQKKISQPWMQNH